MKSIGLIASCLLSLAAWGVPTVSDLTVTPVAPWGMVLDYTVSGATAAEASVPVSVTATDGNRTYVARTLSGATNCTNGRHRVYWNMAKDGVTATAMDSVVQVEYAALYCVVDLSGGTSATSYPVSYFWAAPARWTDEYKTTKLVLRRVSAGSFIMGDDQADESHRVTLTKPFYVGVFEVTQRQWELVMGSNPSSYTGDMRPVECVSYNDIRGSSDGARWPASSAVDATSFLGRLRAKTGLDGFDLPTEAQWEYVCRAGTTSAFNNGGDTEGDLKTLGRYRGNLSDGRGGYTYAHTAVGSYMSNDWGLYDMHGNVWEMCLDWYGTLGYGIDPVGSSSGSSRVHRGIAWSDYYYPWSLRYFYAPSDYGSQVGFRLVRTLNSRTEYTVEGSTMAEAYHTIVSVSNVSWRVHGENVPITDMLQIDYVPDGSGQAVVSVDGQAVVDAAIPGTYMWRPQANGMRTVAHSGWDGAFTATYTAAAPSGGMWLHPSTAVQTYGPDELDADNRYDFYRISMTAGWIYTFETTGDGDTYGELFSSASTDASCRVASDDGGGDGGNFKLTYTPAVSGTYYLRVRAYDVGTSLSYTLSYTVICDGLSTGDIGTISVDEREWWYRVEDDGSAMVTRMWSATGDTDNIEIPSNFNGRRVTGIGEAVFENWSGLTSVKIPDGVTEIGDSAFRGCSELTSVTIGSGVTNIGRSAFYGCWSLSGVAIPDGVTSIGDGAFFGCDNLMSVTIGSGVTRIGDFAFQGCRSLVSSVTIPDGVTSIGRSAFSGCCYLESVTIGSGVTHIGDSAFSGCWSLSSVTIPTGVTSIGSSAFSDCSDLTSVTIPAGVTSIESSAFEGCRGLTSVAIPASVTEIGYGAFYGCSGLTSVTIPAGVTSIESFAFYGCSGLTSVTIPTGVTSIGSSAFEGCRGLTSVTIPSGVTSIGGGAFADCSALLAFTVESDNVYYKSVNGLLLSKDGVTLIAGVNGDIMIPSSVTSIGDFAFEGRRGLTSVTIPSGVTGIGSSVFSGCSGLTSVTIPSSVTSIGSSAFWGCSGLTSVTIPSGVTNIGSSAFEGCSRLSSVTIPAGVTSIESSAFEGCSGLTSVTIPAGVTSIGSSAFYGCRGLTSVTIPSSVTSIGSSAFWGCSGLTSVTIPSGVTSIRSGAFYDCSGLKEIVFAGNAPATVGGNYYRVFPSSATVYVKPGSTGWGVEIPGTWQGCPIRYTEGAAAPALPTVAGDAGATVTGDAAAGYTVTPSADNKYVTVTIPDGVSAAKVTVVVGPNVATIRSNGAALKVVRNGHDITAYLDIPAANYGVVELASATVKEAIVKETLDIAKGAVIDLSSPSNPSLTTAPTRKGLVYTLREGATLDAMRNSATKVGDGQPWTPPLTVKGGASGFYTIRVSK